MKRAIKKNWTDFAALIVMFLASIVVSLYILGEQRFRFPLVQERPMKLSMDFESGRAVIPGQGQTVRVAGWRIGDVQEVQLIDGRARVTVGIDPQYTTLVHKDAKALLRPRTGLKDMFIELDPGSKDAPLMKENEVIPVENTAPDVDPDEVLSMLDRDTRAYLQLLLIGGGKGLQGRSSDLRGVYKNLGPVHRDLARLNSAVA